MEARKRRFRETVHNNWHRHFGYQVLMLTGGEGYYQEWGKPVRRIKAGDIVVSEPGGKALARCCAGSLVRPYRNDPE